MNLIPAEEVEPLREIVSMVAILHEMDMSPLSKWPILNRVIEKIDVDSNISSLSVSEILMNEILIKNRKLEEEYLKQQTPADHDNA